MKHPKRINVKGHTYERAAIEESTSRKPQSWPVYQSEEEQEQEQVENVFGLGGGELEKGKFAGYAYWYENVPDWAERDFPDWAVNQHRTVIIFGGGYLPYPEKMITDQDGDKWELAKYYGNSGEADCWICGAGGNGKEWWADEFEDQHDRPPKPDDYCGLCETEYKDMPGYVYVAGGYEAVYRLVEDEENEEE